MILADKSDCTGCGACAKICPRQAISFFDDEEGFPTPYIHNDICVDCGLCETVCPVKHPIPTHPILEAYAAQSRDHETLIQSSSGGLFSAFSGEVFRRGGIVYGCLWDDHYNAVIVRAENEEELKPMRGSKYVWSYAGNIFPEIRNFLNEGKIILFAGLPCQVAGLKGFLRKEYDNLITQDFLCSGTPSPLAFHSWLDTITKDPKPSMLNLKFRDKNPNGWGVHITYNGKKEKKAKRYEWITNPYYYAFYSHLIDRRCCYHCPYGMDNRISDVTLGDYWGIEKYHKNMNRKDGISALMINTDKGADLFESIRTDLNLEQTAKEYIGKENNLKCNEVKRNRQIPAIRDDFFSDCKQYGWKTAEKNYLHDSKWLIYQIKSFLPECLIKFAKKILNR